MLGSLGGTHTWFTVRSWSVRKSELAEVSADHIEFDINWAEFPSTIDTYDGSNHLWHYDSISEMGPDFLWLFSLNCFSLSLHDFKNQSLEFMTNTATESSPDP